MSLEAEMQSALANFVLEADELLADMEFGLLELEQGEPDDETINSVFRAAHTIKGSAGLFGLDPIVHFTHRVESVLDRLRAHEIDVDAAVISALLPCKDHIGRLVAAVGAGTLDQVSAQDTGTEDLLARLAPFLAPGPAGDPAAPGPVPAGGPDPSNPAAREIPRMHLSLRFGSDSLRNGMDPLSFIRYLSTLGDVVAVSVVADGLPPAEEMDAEICYLAFELTLSTAADVETVAGVFDFVREDSDIRILPAGSPAAAYRELIESYGPQAAQVAQVLLDSGAVDEALLANGPSTTDPHAGDPAEVPRQRSQSVDEQSPPGAPAGSRRTTDRRAADRGAADGRTIRVDAERLDRLIDAVGELVIAGAGAALRASLSGDKVLETSVDEVMRLVEEVRDDALQLRMVPIGSTLSRFQRVVRDVSASLGKDVGLVITGGDTEVDKALVEQIGDPLMHLVRNALDHGIESPQQRAAAGKPVRGVMRLNAFHDSGSIVIEVQDDGGGIAADRVLAKAAARGLIGPDAVLSEKEIYDLIFEPGFSTADQVSDLSGRGVGMDVVKRNVTALRGTIDVESRPGLGTTFRIRLPLTLAIIDGFLVGAGDGTFVIPLDRVVECVAAPPETGRRDCMDLRGEVLPIIRLRSLFAMAGSRPRRENVVVVEYAGAKTGLVVDTLRGEFQTVIKPLGRLFARSRGIGGSTILGNGDVALIIDVPMLVRHAASAMN